MLKFELYSAEVLLQDWLSYSDIEKSINWELDKRQRGLMYAESLKKLALKHGNSKVEEVRRFIRHNYEFAITTLGLHNTVSPFSKSISWVFWDLGKQFFYFNNPRLSNSNYHLQDPCISIEKQREIMYRHLGWEVYHYDLENSVLTSLDKNLPSFASVKGRLQNSQRKEIQLSSYQYSELGSLIIQSSAVGNIDCESFGPNDNYSEWAIKRKTKYLSRLNDKLEKENNERIKNYLKQNFERLPHSKDYIEEYGKITLIMCQVIENNSVSKSVRAGQLEPYFMELDKIADKYQMGEEHSDFVVNNYFLQEWLRLNDFLTKERKTK